MANSMSFASPAAMPTRAQRISDAIIRLDDCADRLEQYRENLGEALYADLVSQAYAYASFLTECRVSGMSPADPRLREVTKEMIQFCDFLEEEMPI